MLAWINFLALALSVNFSTPDSSWDDWENDQEFNFYLGEFAENRFEDGSSYQRLLEERLSAATLKTTRESVFKNRLRQLQEAYRRYPETQLRFQRLDELLQDGFSEKLKKAKRIRWISATGGAVIGALVAIPIGKSMGSSLAGKALYIAIPIGALSGAGLGFLLGDIFAMPDYRYEDLGVSSDIESGLREIETALEGDR